MRLVCHNMMSCPVQNCDGFPFKILLDSDGLRTETSTLSEAAVKAVIAKLDWPAFREAAATLGKQVPPTADNLSDEEVGAVADVALNLWVETGALVCPKCGITYPIDKGIPNLLAGKPKNTDDEGVMGD